MSLYLIIKIRGEYYKVNSKGEMIQNNRNDFSGQWKFLGISTHHMHNTIIHTFFDIWNDPSLALNGYLWDIDYGTIRKWGGNYNGKLPKITACYKVDE